MTTVGVVAHSSKTLGGGLGALRTALAQHGIDDPLWREVPKSKFIPKMVAELVQAGVDLLFVWGGDGTVQRCINTVGKAPITLAILPAGTSNLFARNLCIPTDLEEAVSIGLSGQRRTLDVGTVNGERFGVMAGIGFDAVMIRNADDGLKDRLGRFAYVVAGVRGVGRDAVQTRVEVDGMAWFNGPATCVLVGNMGDVLGGISAFPDARPDDGRLNVGIITADGIVDWARTLGRTVIGHPGSSPFVETTTAMRIDVRLKKKLPYELDGGARAEAKRLTFQVQPAAITCVFPRPRTSNRSGSHMVATPAAPRADALADRLATFRRALEGIIGVPATEGNTVEVLRNGNEIFPAMLDSIAHAKRTIDLLTFVYWRGEIGTRFAEALTERAGAGVRVRVLLDAWGAHPIERSLLTEMQAAGVHVAWFRPLVRMRARKTNHRTHRKVLVVDEAIGFTGGVGIADEWNGDARSEREWRDTHFRVRGPAVDGLRAAFLDNWIETNDVLFESTVDRFPEQPRPGSTVVQSVRGASEVGWSDISTLFLALLQLAQERVRITTAYFVPDAQLNDRLSNAAERGVRVEILLPGPHADKRFVQLAGESSYQRLLESGVRIWHFQPSMLHAKVMTIDGAVANIGSANLNARSTALDEEINLVAFDPVLVGLLDTQFDVDVERSEEVAPGRWKRRPVPQRVFERAAGLLRREI